MPGNRVAKSSISRASSHAPPAESATATARATTSLGRELAARVGIQREPVALAVDQDGAGASNRFGDERRRVDVGKLERGGMELEELDVPELGAGAVGERPAVRRGDPRIGGDRVELSHTAGGQHDRGRRDGPARAVRPDHRHTDRSSRVDPDRGHLGVLHQLDHRMGANHLRQAADQRRARAVAARVDDPRPRVGRLQPEPEPAVRAPIEPGPQGQKLVNPSRTFTCKDANGFGVGQAVAGGHGVGGVLAGAVSGSEGHGDAALGPRAGAVGQRLLGENDRALPLRREPPRGPEPCDARTDDHGAGSCHGDKYTGETLLRSATSGRGPAARSPPPGTRRWATRRPRSDPPRRRPRPPS